MPGRLTDIGFVNDLMARKINPDCNLTVAQHMAKTAKYRAMVDDLQSSDGKLTIYNPVALLCDTSRGICPMSRGGNYLYSYDDHISDYSNGLLAKDIEKLLGAGA